jgi:glycosyltransferase involved in cell wall biosynthesis/predicted O-methyltransferase YrrM
MNFNIESFLQAYKGGISIREGLALADYAKNCTLGCIVEVGSFKGKSAVALAYGQAQRQDKIKYKIYCIEPHETFIGVYGGKFGPADRGEFYRIMLDTGYYSSVALINLPSVDAASGWKSPIGLLFIDGDHRYESVKQDVSVWEQHLSVGGVIALDDAIDKKVGPFWVIRELLEQGRFEYVQKVGKIVFLRKNKSQPQPRAWKHGGKNIAVACHDLMWSGGLLRFERFGRVATASGHKISFVRFSQNSNPCFKSKFEVLELKEACEHQWDVTMIPGAGFPATTIQEMKILQRPNFGIRIQHILNDQTRLEKFLYVNNVVCPHIVVFNNRHWPVDSFTKFQAHRFHFLEGAVDSVNLSPKRYVKFAHSGERKVIGGLANNNPIPLIEATRLLSEDYTLRLFGKAGDLSSIARDLISAGRLELVGMLNDAELKMYYEGLDCVVHTERFAGWSNLAAEALACGVPLICTKHGTMAFAENGVTAIVIAEPNAEAIRSAIEYLFSNEELARRLSRNGRDIIARFTWERYTQELLAISDFDGRSHYIHAPEIGLYGKWSIKSRLSGLEPILKRCRNKTVVDFGAAEGIVSLECLKNGAALVHGFDIDPSRIETARKLSSQFSNAVFRQADLASWQTFKNAQRDLLKDNYDIVLYLGLQHHLPRHSRIETLIETSMLAKELFVIRTTETIYNEDDIRNRLEAEMFHLLDENSELKNDFLGSILIFQRDYAPKSSSA